MSQADVERFVRDIKTNTDLQQAIKAGAGGLQSVVNIANQRGYQITIGEARQYMRDKASNLTDAELDALAGGKGPPPPGQNVSVEVVTVGVQTVGTTVVVEVVAT
jgi:predicted ribosomally synthesized peptide with nif11-like leader